MEPPDQHVGAVDRSVAQRSLGSYFRIVEVPLVAHPMNAVGAVFPVQQASHSPPFIPRHPVGKEASARGRHRSSSVWSPLSGWETAVVRPVDTPQGYLPGLDGLRAVAVLAVVAYHQGL